jgi:hypothetical protein
MKQGYNLFLPIICLISISAKAQNIGDFTSITPTTQSNQFIIASSHTFQKIIQVDDFLTDGATKFPRNPDFTGFVPILGSSTNGYLSINSETGPGGNTILDINFDATTKLWNTTASEAVDFSSVAGTFANCSGAVTPWGTVISSEEYSIPIDNNLDNYYDHGWNVEIDPVTKTVVNNQKLWAMGNFSHENVAIHSNLRTVYQGADVVEAGKVGYLYKFVATTVEDLSDGLLYVYKGSKNGSGNWVLLKNSTPTERNETYIRSGADPDLNDADTDFADATTFAGIEDVEIGPDGLVYFAVKGAPDKRVYRFQDSDPISGTTVVNMETFVGNTDVNPNITYNINDGTNTTAVAWGAGNDNLAFDGDGNLWVLQDGGNNYIWVVKNGHTQASPDVEIFGIVPTGSEPTGITFTPDYKYLFMSVMHPDSGNVANQIDAAGVSINFDKGAVIAIALNPNLGTALSLENSNFDAAFKVFPNPMESYKNIMIKGAHINNLKLYDIHGKELLNLDYKNANQVHIDLQNIKSGLYILKVNEIYTHKLIIK